MPLISFYNIGYYFHLLLLILGLFRKEDLKYLSAKDFRSCISSWASEHKSEEVSVMQHFLVSVPI